jgi:hypothetical protein
MDALTAKYPAHLLRAYAPADCESDGYPSDWGQIAAVVKEAAGWRCVRCQAENSREGARVLTVHHLDGAKANCRWWNLAALCQRCHLHIQGTVKMHQGFMFEHSEWFKPYAAGYYAHSLLGLELSYGEVMRRLEELLCLQRRVM